MAQTGRLDRSLVPLRSPHWDQLLDNRTNLGLPLKRGQACARTTTFLAQDQGRKKKPSNLDFLCKSKVGNPTIDEATGKSYRSNFPRLTPNKPT